MFQCFFTPIFGIEDKGFLWKCCLIFLKTFACVGSPMKDVSGICILYLKCQTFDVSLSPVLLVMTVVKMLHRWRCDIQDGRGKNNWSFTREYSLTGGERKDYCSWTYKHLYAGTFWKLLACGRLRLPFSNISLAPSCCCAVLKPCYFSIHFYPLGPRS